MRRVDIAGIAVEARSGAPLVVLREQLAPHRFLPIIIGAPEASALALAATGDTAGRPNTHDVMAALILSTGAIVDHVEVLADLDGVFSASIALNTPVTRRVGSRPSDALALAVRTGAPVMVDARVLDLVGLHPDQVETSSVDDPMTGPAADRSPDPRAIDGEVEMFRNFLADIIPEDFVDS